MRERERYLVTVKDWNLKKEHLYNTSNVIFLKRERERGTVYFGCRMEMRVFVREETMTVRKTRVGTKKQKP